MAVQDKVLFLGPEGTYTHQAALDAFSSTPHALHPAAEIEDIFHGVQHGAAAYGVVPVENSSNGAVVPTMDLLVKAAARFPDVLVCGEAYVRVQHCLVGRRHRSSSSSSSRSPATTPGSSSSSADDGSDADSVESSVADGGSAASLARIRAVYSHPQAWGQCTTFLATRLPPGRVKRADVSSTSRAAQMAAADRTGATAAIASAAAAHAHGLDVLVAGVSDFGGNTTRFWVLRRSGGRLEADASAAPGEYRALVAFAAAEPEVVSRALGALAGKGVPVANVTTRPSGERAWERVFFVEIVLGGAVEEALEELGRVAEGWRWLGSWESRSAA